MEAEAILKLFDSCWFGIQDLKEQQPGSSTSSRSSHENTDQQIQMKGGTSETKLSRMQTIHNRSMSDQLTSMTCSNHDSHSHSPEFDFSPPKLQTILSGKDVILGTEEGEGQAHVQLEVLPKKNNTNNGRKKKRESKSLSDLEFEELKGFMDLGFVFSEEDKDSSLASIIPGLQRLGKNGDEEEEQEGSDESAIPRPYLSEAWKIHERRKKKENPLMNWKVPALNNENDMKDSLRLWAHTVASTVR